MNENPPHHFSKPFLILVLVFLFLLAGALSFSLGLNLYGFWSKSRETQENPETLLPVSAVSPSPAAQASNSPESAIP